MTKRNAIAQYIRNVRERQNATWRITPDGQSIYLYKGAVLEERAFLEMFPLNVIHNKREDIDPRRTWMRGLPKI